MAGMAHAGQNSNRYSRAGISSVAPAPSPMAKGAVTVVYGEQAISAAHVAVAALCQHNPGLPIIIIGAHDPSIPGTEFRHAPDRDPGARLAKLRLWDAVPAEWEQVFYFDADTIPRADISPGFEILSGGWDMVAAPSSNQADGPNWLWHVSLPERQAVEDRFRCRAILVLQAGILWLQRSQQMIDFFDRWQSYWHQGSGQDQAAMLLALADVPLRIWLFGRPWNGGHLIAHRFGSARRQSTWALPGG